MTSSARPAPSSNRTDPAPAAPAPAGPRPGYHTYNEILSQPEAWAAALEVIQAQRQPLLDLFRSGRYESVLVTGCGSPYYLSQSTAIVLQEISGLPARAIPASEAWLQPQSVFTAGRRTLLLALSRSGETTELLKACEAFRLYGTGEIVTLCCYPGSRLASVGSINLVLPSGQETSLVQTRAFTTLQVAALAFTALWAGRDDLLEQLSGLPVVCRRLLATYEGRGRALGQDASLDRFYFLGTGSRYGLACELGLKMQEMSLSHSQAFRFMEFRHGPKAMLTPSTLIVGLLSDAARSHEAAVVADIQSSGARTLLLGEAEAEISFNSGLAEALRGPLYLPIGQLLSYEHALHKGLDPDLPNNLNAVVTLEDQ